MRSVSPRAKTIKLADMIDNTFSIVERDPAFAKVYLAEKAALLSAVARVTRPRRLRVVMAWGSLMDDYSEIRRSIMPRNSEALSCALATMARASRGRPAANSSIALRKQAIVRSAVRASSVGGMFSCPV
jgi:hypothetical protein